MKIVLGRGDIAAFWLAKLCDNKSLMEAFPRIHALAVNNVGKIRAAEAKNRFVYFKKFPLKEDFIERCEIDFN